jgi:sulfite reductase (ferredoxin)
MAELGLVGSAPEAYQIWLGGSPNQIRLAEPYEEKMPLTQLEKFFEPIFVFFRDHHKNQESFGDFCHRIGFDAIRDFAKNYQPTKKKSRAKGEKRRRVRQHEHRISVNDSLYEKLKAVATENKKSMKAILTEALETYLTEGN